RLSRKLFGHVPSAGREDLRGWEWYYLLSLCHQDERTLMGQFSQVTSIAWSPDGRHLASADDDGHTKVWDTTSWRLLRTFVGERGVCWSPDGQKLAWGWRGRSPVRVWHVQTDEVKDLWGHTSSVWTTAWSPDGQRVASAGMDGTIRIWEPATGSCLRVLKVE